MLRLPTRSPLRAAGALRFAPVPLVPGDAPARVDPALRF